ncbi:MAG: hypothetical protein LKI28_03635 [Ancrocorticia sp.]|nr:hypothetical protein [Ancrocorticia sp.]
MSTVGFFTLAIAAGLLTETVFRLLRLRRIEEIIGATPLSVYRNSPMMYMSVQEACYMGPRMIPRYVVFRFVPPLIAFLLVAAISDRNEIDSRTTLLGLLATAIVAAIARVIPSGEPTPLSLKVHLFQGIVLLLVFAEGTLVWVASNLLDLSALAPTSQGLVDSLWSAMLVAAVIFLYLSLLRVKPPIDPLEQSLTNAKTDAVLARFASLQSQFRHIVESACSTNHCSKNLLWAVLIYEDMNRPAFVRIIENWLVRLPGVSMTVGIGQVASLTPLTDEQSIERAASLLANSEAVMTRYDLEQNTDANQKLAKYNDDPRYTDEICQILDIVNIGSPGA